MMSKMDKIEPLKDYVALARFAPGDKIRFGGQTCTIWSKTTLASGEPAVVLQGEGKQFVVRAAEFLEAVKN
jgi:hypothetical protein